MFIRRVGGKVELDDWDFPFGYTAVKQIEQGIENSLARAKPFLTWEFTETDVIFSLYLFAFNEDDAPEYQFTLSEVVEESLCDHNTPRDIAAKLEYADEIRKVFLDIIQRIDDTIEKIKSPENV